MLTFSLVTLLCIILAVILTYDLAFNKGYIDGVKDGRPLGYSEGLIQGRKEGYEDGKESNFARQAFKEHFNRLNPELAQDTVPRIKPTISQLPPLPEGAKGIVKEIDHPWPSKLYKKDGD